MSQTVGDFVIERLHNWGVRHLFGYPGDGINGVFGGLNRAEGKIKFIQTRHEEMAAFMASAYAKFSSNLGVCIATSGPGASHLITGLYDALLDHQPVLAIVGQQARNALGGQYQQELDLVSMFKDVAGAYVEQASSSCQVRHLIDRAARISLSRRTVTAIILPNDLQDEPYEDPPRAHGTLRSSVGYARPKIVPHDADLDTAAAILNAGKKVAMLIGAGALGAADEVIVIADRLSAGCAKALLGKAVLPDELPWVTGSIGLLGTEPSYNLMTECDTLLMVGSAFPYAEFLPKEGKARGVQIDIEAGMLSMRFPMDIGLVGDAADTLRALLPRLKQKPHGNLAKNNREPCPGLVEDAGEACEATCRSGQSAAGHLGIVTTASGARYHHQRLRFLRQLVCARSQDASGHDGVALRWPGVDGGRGPLRHSGQICPARSAGYRAGRRRRHANEQHGRTDHGREILARMERPSLDRLRLQQ